MPISSTAAGSARPSVSPSIQPFLTVGVVATIAGGVVAAVTGPTDWDDGSWVAAFLVLVVGVGQVGLGVGQAMLSDPVPSRRHRQRQAAVFCLASALVLAGTLATTPLVVTVGGVVMLVALVGFVRTTYRAAITPSWVARGYLALLVVLIVSTPIGLVLAWLRA